MTSNRRKAAFPAPGRKADDADGGLRRHFPAVAPETRDRGGNALVVFEEEAE